MPWWIFAIPATVATIALGLTIYMTVQRRRRRAAAKRFWRQRDIQRAQEAAMAALVQEAAMAQQAPGYTGGSALWGGGAEGHCGKELGHTYVITTSYASYIRVRI